MFSLLFIESAHWADSIIESRCPSVCLMSDVPFHVLDFKAYFARCPKILEIWNPWGKVLERSGLRIEHYSWEEV